MKLTKSEELLEEEIFNGEWISRKDKIKEFQAAAKEHNRKNKIITIRLSKTDYELIRERAENEAIPYQTMIGSLIHKFVKNQFIEKQQAKMVLSELN